MSRIRALDPTGSRLAIEGERVVAEILAPERVLEALAQGLGVGIQVDGELVAAEIARLPA
jgi:hypothetical protein